MRDPIRAVGAAIVLGLAGLAGLACGAQAPGGLLLVTLDTTRADHLGAYGWQAARTPTLDRLAREGLLFENAVAPAPITLPSHASILTGVAPPAHGVRDNGIFELSPEAELVSEVLRREGWRTGAFVGSFVLNGRFGLDQGFETYRAPVPAPGGPPGFQPERRAAAVVDDFLDWFSGLGSGERFFAWVHFFDPHHPYLPPQRWRSEQQHPYDAEITYTDHELGRLLDALAERGRADDLLVVVTADHGEGAGEHGENGHGVFVYQATLRVPLIFWGTALAPWAGQRVQGFVSLLDLPATLLAFAGLEPQALPKAASRPLVVPGRGPAAPDPARPIYVESLLPFHSFRWRALRGLIEDGYKLVEFQSPELYALSEDAGEQRNLAAAEPERVARLQQKLRELVARDADLGWGQARSVDAREREMLHALGYTGGAGGSGPFDPGLPDPRERVGDISLVMTASTFLFMASKQTPLEPGAFVDGPDGEPVPGRELIGKAARMLRELRERNPRDPHVYTDLGTIYSLLGRPELARPLLEEAVRLRPGDAALHYHLAHAYEATGELGSSVRAMRAALALDPDNPRYAEWLAERGAAEGQRAFE